MRPTQHTVNSIDNMDLRDLKIAIEMLKMTLETRVDQIADPDSYKLGEIDYYKTNQKIFINKIQKELETLTNQFKEIRQYLES